jgi:hypothetical protein
MKPAFRGAYSDLKHVAKDNPPRVSSRFARHRRHRDRASSFESAQCGMEPGSDHDQLPASERRRVFLWMKTLNGKQMQRLIFSIACILAVSTANAADRPEDLRKYQHGINLVAAPDGKKLLFWSSSGNPPAGAAKDGSWTHDVYVAAAGDTLQAQRLISAPEAQEPASAAISSDGRIMVTMEDGWNSKSEVTQRFGIYDAALNPVRPYPQVVAEGGHSGHVAAAGNRFVVFYADGWVNSGGVDNLGSGKDVLAKAYDSNGRLLWHRAIATGTRDWWPLVAASGNRALLVWQRFVEGATTSSLMIALIDPATGRLVKKPLKLADELQYYNYAVAYVPAVDRFLITGTRKEGKGFAFLLDNSGRLVAKNLDLPPTVREAWPAVRGTRILQPTAPDGAQMLSVKNDRIEAMHRYADHYQWQGIGAAAEFDDDGKARVYALSKNGMVIRKWDGPDDHR